MTSVRSVVALCLAAVATLAAQSDSAPQQAIARIEAALVPPAGASGVTAVPKTLAERMRELKVPGVSAAVFRDGRVEWARGWGLADVESGLPVDRSTRFQAASISKPVAAAVVLALAGQGRLSLDEDVNRYLTRWKLPANAHTAAAPVTLRRLLTHSAGTTVHGFRGYAAGEPVPTLVQLLDGAPPANSAAVRVDIPVGSRVRYSGGGFSVLQLVVEEVTKQPFADAARALVLEPLGMRASTYEQPLPDTLRASAATGYSRNGEAVAGKFFTHPEQAAAGLWTTPEDLATFAIALQRSAAGQSAALPPALVRDMLRTQIEDWGLGVGLMGDGADTVFMHNGANVGFRATWIGFRDRASGVVVMTNADNGSALAGDLVRTVAREYGFRGLGQEKR